jgi:hypothetical protein
MINDIQYKPIQKHCKTRSVIVREEMGNLTISTGEMNVINKGGYGHGYYFGVVEVYDREGVKQLEKFISRSFILRRFFNGDYIKTTTASVSQLADDDLSMSFLKRYVSQRLVSGHNVATMNYVTSNGTTLQGNHGFPTYRCYDD